MNKSNIPTSQKIMIPLRLSPKLYESMMRKVQERKTIKRGYSVNEFLTDLIELHLEEIDK